jgi:hypothetical protein
LRLVLLLGEFSQVTPPGMDIALWRGDLKELADRLTACCRDIDPASTEYMLAHAADQDIVVKEPPAATGADVQVTVPESGAVPTIENIESEPPIIDEFGAGLVDSE